MNDRFKFRVWDIEEWTYLKCKYSKSAGYHKYTFGKHNVWQDIGYFIESNPKYYIVEQCTGLKDKNGNLIYEGDVVEITIFGSVGPNGGYVDSDEIYKGTVVWERDCFLAKTDTDTILFPHSEDCIEIVGNIHEQAEQKEE